MVAGGQPVLQSGAGSQVKGPMDPDLVKSKFVGFLPDGPS
jgi:hypothetical protein